MLGLVVRILVLCAVMAGVAYALVRAWRARAESQEAARVANEIAELRRAIERQSISPAEYTATAERIRRDCARLGIAAPELPPHFSPRNGN